MRIAHVISGLVSKSGGTTTAVLEMARWQAILGEKVTIIAGSASDTDVAKNGLNDFGVRIDEFPILGPRLLRYAPNLREYLRRHVASYDLFVIHSSYQYPAFAASKYCKRARIPYILMPHGSLDPAVRIRHPLRNRVIDYLYHDQIISGAAALHFTSEGERARCERRIWRQAFVEPLGFNLEAVPRLKRRGQFRGKYAIPETATLLLLLSRITRKKGIGILLEAFHDAAKRNNGLYLALCGQIDADMTALIKQYRQLPEVGDRIIVTGHLVGEAKDDAFFDADYFVLPTYSENFGIAVFEALAYGLPVITTTGMDLHAELLTTGRVKIIEPNAAELAKTLGDVVGFGWRPKSSVDKVRGWLEQKYSWRVRAANILANYKRTLEQAGQTIVRSEIRREE